MSQEKNQVIRFYEQIWNAHDKSVIPEVLDEHFTFRGSLGVTKKGHDGFAEYVDMIHQALDQYKCIIEDLVIESPKVFAKLTFQGIHKSVFMGYEPTGKQVSWAGAALFNFKNGKILDLWILGDLKSLERQLAKNGTDKDPLE